MTIPSLAADREALALRLMAAARTLAAAVEDVNDLWRTDPETLAAEPTAADVAVLQGPEVMAALRTLAMRMDRAASVKSMPDE